MLKVAIAVNIFLTAIAVGLALALQQMSPLMIRAANFERFRDRVSDQDLGAILKTTSDILWLGLFPLVVTNILWIAILWFSVLYRQKHASSAELGSKASAE